MYTRVIPRDLFNEAKLLKCMGRLALLRHSGPLPEGVAIDIDENGEPFNVVQLIDGELTIWNYRCKLGGRNVVFLTPYNAKAAYPLQCHHGDEMVEVFHDDGELTMEFVDLARRLATEKPDLD